MFIHRPGGVTDPMQNVYATWPELMTALELCDGAADLVFDDNITTPIVIPAPTVPGTSYDMTDVQWLGNLVGGPATVHVADGVSFVGLYKIGGYLQITSYATISPCLLTHKNLIIISEVADISCAVTAAPFWSGSTLTAGQYAFFSIRGRATLQWWLTERPVIDLPVTGTSVYVQLLDSSLVRDCITGVVGTTLQWQVMSYAGGVFRQPGFLGTISYSYHAQRSYTGNPPYPTISATAGVTASQNDYIRLNAAAGSFTQALPRIASVGTSEPIRLGFCIAIVETSGVNGVTLDAYGAETIHGALTYALPPGGSIVLVADGVSNWEILGINPSHLLNRVNTFTKAQGTAQAALADNAAGITPDLSLSNSFRCNLGAVAGDTRQLGIPTGMIAGFTYSIEFVQPAGPTAVQALTLLAANWKFPGGAIPTLTATNSAKDRIIAYYDGDAMQCEFKADYRNP